MTLVRCSRIRSKLFSMFFAILVASPAIASSYGEFVVYSFPSPGAGRINSIRPHGNLITDAAGNLYGTTAQGGEFLRGTVYRLSPPVPPGTTWTEADLYSFAGGDGGSSPQTGLTFDQAGNLYGTTSVGGTSGLGTVFELSPPAIAGGAWTESVLYSFQGGTSDGASPGIVGVSFDRFGNLYGATPTGGLASGSCDANGCGVVFQLTPPGASGGMWAEKVLYYFNGTDGSVPSGTPILDTGGNLYGLASHGGAHNAGVVYGLRAPVVSDGSWAYEVLYNFPGSGNGSPSGNLTFHGDGILCGTASGFRAQSPNPFGLVFQLVPPAVAGAPWTENILHSFGGGSDGSYPESGVVFDSAGHIYGTTIAGGTYSQSCVPGVPEAGCGIVFQLIPPTSEGGSWIENILHVFDDNNGDVINGGVVIGKNGLLFGVTVSGGTHQNGVVYAVVR